MLFSSPGKSGLDPFWKLPFTYVVVLSLPELCDMLRAEINNQDSVMAVNFTCIFFFEHVFVGKINKIILPFKTSTENAIS